MMHEDHKIRLPFHCRHRASDQWNLWSKMHYSFDQGVGEYHCAAAPKPLVAETQEIGVVLQLEAYLKKKI